MSGFMIAELVHTDPEFLANSYYSSQDSAFPASNAYNLDRRKRVWHSAGYWNIFDGSNTLVFSEGGPNLTAEIDPGEYASDALFFAAIKSAMEDVGANTYTVTRSVGKVQIASNTTYSLILTDPDSADIAALLGYSTAANRTGANTYAADAIRIHYKERLVWDNGIPVNPTMFMAVSSRNNPINISPTATIKLKGSHTNAWETVIEEFTIPYRENILAYINSDGIASNTYGYRYWALEIQDVENPDGYVELGAVALCTHTAVSRGCPAFPLEVPDVDLTTVSNSEGGQTITGIRQKTEKFGLSWESLDVQSYENLKDVWEKFGLHSSFFIAMDQNNAFSTDGETMIRLVKFDNEPASKLVSPMNWSTQWALKEEL